jgi:cytidyltransferase-like protein
VKTTAVYPGSFDPITKGHTAILKSGLVAFEKIIVAVLNNEKKEPLFSVEERMDMIRESVVDMGEDIVGTSAFKELVTSFRTAFPDFNVTFDEVFAAGDTTVIQWTMTGTNTGPFGDLPPTGQPVTLHGVAISRAVDGMTVEVWQHYNQLFMFQQMGFTLTPP